MCAERKEAPVCKALKNTTEEKWNCNVWINNDPSYASLYKHMDKDIYTLTHEKLFKIISQGSFWPHAKNKSK